MEGTRNNFQIMGKRIKISQTTKHIPQDILQDILVNLPVKSLLRFKCVSKQWHSLISSKQFTKEHLKKSSELGHHNLMYNSSYCYDQTYQTCFLSSLRSCSLKSFLIDKQSYEDHSMVTTSNHDSFLPTSRLEAIIGSCNGLILFTSKIAPRWDELTLWNPSTRQVKIIPPPPLYARRKCYCSYHHFVYGFGYDDSSDDYKVVSIFVSKTGPYKTQMYSLMTNSWKKIGDFEKGHLTSCSATHVNGKLHWLVEEGGVGGKQIIVSLSLVDGKYDIIPLPPLQFKLDYCYNLRDLGGYLSVMRKEYIIFLKAFVMMKYGEVESWTDISRLCSANGPIDARDSRPIWLSKNGDVLVTLRKSRVTVTNNAYRSRVFVVDAKIHQHNNIYVESLVSPFGDKKLG